MFLFIFMLDSERARERESGGSEGSEGCRLSGGRKGGLWSPLFAGLAGATRERSLEPLFEGCRIAGACGRNSGSLWSLPPGPAGHIPNEVSVAILAQIRDSCLLVRPHRAVLGS